MREGIAQGKQQVRGSSLNQGNTPWLKRKGISTMDAIDRLKQDCESTLTETMTMQEIKHRFPSTRSVLEGLCIDSRFEGSDCLDEVAWRHGMESRELLALLEEEVARPMPQVLDGGRAPREEHASAVLG